MKLLITGGLGHIGSYVLQNINRINKIKELYIIDNFLSNKIHSLFKLKKKKTKIFFIKKDLAAKNSLKKFTKVDVVLNLASITDAEKSLSIKKEIYRNNVGIFNNVVNYCIKNSAKLIHISSTSVYGRQTQKVDENCKNLKPQTPYAKIKLIEENILKKNTKKIKFVTYRFGTIAGISKGMRFHTAVNKFCLSAMMNDPIPVWKGALHQKRPYLSLRDAFKIIKYAIDNNFFKNQIYNVLSNNYTVNDIIKMIKKYKKKIKIKFITSKILNQLSYEVSREKVLLENVNLNSKITHDIKDTLNLFKNVNDGM